jgi:hypothetical protein
MSQQNATAVQPANGQSSAQDLFALTDEQILEIEPETQDAQIVEAARPSPAAIPNESAETDRFATTHARELSATTSHESPVTSQQSQAGSQQEPPKWLADKMADPQTGGEAREFWKGVQQARNDATAYREIFARPEDARAAADRARTLDEIDAAFYGRAGNSLEQTSAARTQLAQRMMQEDPAGFREMVFAGLRVLESSGNGAHSGPRLEDPRQTPGALRSTPRNSFAPDAQIEAYRAFEQSANQELERSVGGAIERALSQALPNVKSGNESGIAGPRSIVPLQERLRSAIREDIESSLTGDRQLGEQVSQVLSSRRFDDATRAQVVRLINDRAQQLVPVAAKRVINEWTQTTLAAHRAKAQKAQGAAERADLTPAGSAAAARAGSSETARPTSRPGRVDYNKLSDEQILDL